MEVDCVRLHLTAYYQKQEHIFQQDHVLLLVKHIAVSIRQNISSVAIWQTIDKKLRYIRFCVHIHISSMLHCRHFLQSHVSGCQSVQQDSLTFAPTLV